MRLVRYVVLYLALTPLIQSVQAESVVVPVVASGDQIYLGAEFQIADEVALGDKFTSAKQNSAEFLKLVKGNSRSDSSLFATQDGSAAKWLNPSEYGKYEGFKKIDDISYRPAITWGNYLHIPTSYKIGKRDMLWREDYLCASDGCKKSLYDFGQLFEVSYQYYVTKGTPLKAGEITPSMAKATKKDIFDMSSVLTGNQSGPPFMVGISIPSISSSDCVRCEKPVYSNEFEASLLSEVHQFVGKIQDVDLQNETETNALLSRYSDAYKANFTMPMVSWESGDPKLLHVNAFGYVARWKEYLDGKIEGYMLDHDSAYLFVSRLVGDENNSSKQFQIFVLRKNAQGEYGLLPNTDKRLMSRGLMFESQTLKLFSSILGV